MNNELSMLSLRHIFLPTFHFGPEKQLHLRHQLSRYLAGWFVVTIFMTVDFNNVYGVHHLHCSVVSRYRVCPRCTTALSYLQQVTVVFETPRNDDIPSLLFLGPEKHKGKSYFYFINSGEGTEFVHFIGTSGV